VSSTDPLPPSAYGCHLPLIGKDQGHPRTRACGYVPTNGVNMTKLESYQRGGSFAASEFYADIVGKPGEAAVDRALEELGFHSKWVRLLGTYPQARLRG